MLEYFYKYRTAVLKSKYCIYIVVWDYNVHHPSATGKNIQFLKFKNQLTGTLLRALVRPEIFQQQWSPGTIVHTWQRTKRILHKVQK